ncbi:MAG: RidA family protein [Culicoidibacterales bacterium]
MMKAIQTPHAPEAIGPYSQAIFSGDTLYISGQIPFDPKTMTLVSQDIVEQTKQSLENVKAVVEAAGLTLENVVKVGIFITDMDEFVKINEVYAQYFMNHKPARSTVEVSRLPRDVKIEIEAIAIKK